ncbi:MAG: PAS domain S-box protein [Deltaproteobacteria bacterium]|jgi:PAS domain S-box-containing protein|nr:PAS domain S-box protein [Deltaproteobacteria bacterium]MBW2532374.1 PAS domain S-box protein [Deltaproteobacteria bacterium]
MSRPPPNAAALARSEERYRLAFEASAQGFWDWDLSADRWYFSEGLCSMLGYSPAELRPSRQVYLDLIHPEDRAKVERLLDRCVAGEQTTLRTNLRVRSRDGTLRFVQCRGMVVRSEADRGVTRLLGVHLDVSKRREAELALRRSEDRYRMLVESQGEGIGIVDAQEVFTYANPAAERIFGVEPGTLAGRSLRDFVAQAEFDKVAAQTDRRREGERDTYELDFTRGDGRRRTMLVTATPRVDEEGDYLAAFGVFRDITDRKRMEEALREEEERYRQLIESLPHGVALLQRESTVFANQAAIRMLGYDRLDEFTAGPPLEMLVPDERERVLRILADLRRGVSPGPVHYQTRALHRSGREVPVDAYVTRINYRGESALQLFMIDISDRLRAEREHARLEEQLRQSQRLESIGRLAGGVAHDFNNLLSPILLYAELALQTMTSADAHYEEFSQICEAVNQAKKLTQQLLAFGRRQVLQTKVLSINDVISESRRLVRRLIREDVEIFVELEPTLDLVEADPSQLQQVVLNLVINAQDAMPEGGRMTVRTANATLDDAEGRQHGDLPPGAYVTLQVSDTGRGMSPETQEQIFEPFFTTKGGGKGTGLGLATVHGIVKQHGGHVEVRSAPGEGTTFTVYLARASGEASRPSWRPQAARVDAGVRATVLVAEDDDLVRSQVVRILGRAGLEVLAAVDGEDAVGKAAAHAGPIDLLVTDVIMPKLNGRQLYDALLQSRPALRAIFMSGYTNDVIADQGVADEGLRFLQKPFSLHDLLSAVRGALGE